MQLTAVTPAAPEHEQWLHHAIASVTAQTTPIEHLWQVDHDRRGPGAVRNDLLAQVTTPYVVFLDADDMLHPEFAERLLSLARPDRYVYCDWWRVGDDGDEGVQQAPPPCQSWINGTTNAITCILPTDAVREVGGFDEAMTHHEDADLFLRLRIAQVCGCRVPEPLFYYRSGGERSSKNQARDPMMERITRRYRRKNIMACCGGDAPTIVDTSADVRARPKWRGNRRQRGIVTGRLYPRASRARVISVDPRDVTAQPELWERV